LYPQTAAKHAVEPANRLGLHRRHDVRVAIEVMGTLVWTNISDTILGFTPAMSISDAAVWRRSWKRMGGSPSRRSSGRRRRSVMRDPVSGSPN